eukprot:4276298-Amphidinium_carterae.1
MHPSASSHGGNTGRMSVPLRANQYFLLSLDNAMMRTLGKGLQHFMPAHTDLWLHGDERLVVRAALPDEIIEGSASKRVMAENSNGETRPLLRRVVQAGKVLWPALHRCQDQGSVGYVASLFLDNALCMRGSTLPDPMHRLYGRDLQDALKAAGVWVIVIERMAIYNFMTGPFGRHGYHAQVKEGAELYFKLRDHRCEIFRLFYTDLCDELKVPHASRGTDEHYEQMFAHCKSEHLWDCKGEKVKLGRWGSWFHASEKWQGRLTPLKIILTWTGARRGWWKDI